jgi:hypothetical protein
MRNKKMKNKVKYNPFAAVPAADDDGPSLAMTTTTMRDPW